MQTRDVPSSTLSAIVGSEVPGLPATITQARGYSSAKLLYIWAHLVYTDHPRHLSEETIYVAHLARETLS